MEAHEGATEETIRIADQDVSYIGSQDGRLRSYYAIDGDFHLVTTSRRLIERFYEAGRGNASLAASDEFQSARDAVPLDREDNAGLGGSFEPGPRERMKLGSR